MIITIKNNSSESEINAIIAYLASTGLKTHRVNHAMTKIAVPDNPKQFVVDNLKKLKAIKNISSTNGKKYMLVSRESQSKNTVIKVDKFSIGGKKVVVMAGPCSVENNKQINKIAKVIKTKGAQILRGGAFKPRTAPYDFQGLGKTGLKLLKNAARNNGLKVITEVMDPRDVELVNQYTDIFQIGTRNMQNYALLKELGKSNKPVLLKRGMWATYKEFLLAAEYIVAGGNPNVILCERGIRTHVSELRFTLDLNAIPFIKRETHLPIIVDPSHGTGDRELVSSMAKAAIAAGADGLIIETHISPDKSISDADQTISLETFGNLMKELKPLAKALNRNI